MNDPLIGFVGGSILMGVIMLFIMITLGISRQTCAAGDPIVIDAKVYRCVEQP